MTTAEFPVAERRTPGARTAHVPEPAPRWLVLTAFGLVYVLWGSTYLGIRIAIETIPPFLMAGVRFLIAGAILYAFARGRGAPRPE
ncbi:MAG TPA: EamA family transporter, partial [Gemmatimonadaceae bacterium]|nr:EamA family transporter [Gemmatimonadaceae bacterium]